jgi:hypothetical protein
MQLEEYKSIGRFNFQALLSSHSPRATTLGSTTDLTATRPLTLHPRTGFLLGVSLSYIYVVFKVKNGTDVVLFVVAEVCEKYRVASRPSVFRYEFTPYVAQWLTLTHRFDLRCSHERLLFTLAHHIQDLLQFRPTLHCKKSSGKDSRGDGLPRPPEFFVDTGAKSTYT